LSRQSLKQEDGFDPVTGSGTSYVTEGSQEQGRVLVNTNTKSIDKTGAISGYDSSIDGFEDSETQEWLRRRSPECGDQCTDVNQNLVNYLPTNDNPWPHHPRESEEETFGGEELRARHPVDVLNGE